MSNKLQSEIEKIKGRIINIIAKLDNGSHSSNQLQGIDESLFELFSSGLISFLESCLPEESHKSPAALDEDYDKWASGYNACLAEIKSNIEKLKQ